MCDLLVEIAISETYFKFWPLKFRLTSTTRRDRMSPNYAEVKTTCPQNRLKNTRCKGLHAIERLAYATTGHVFLTHISMN
jgi:hypothetical protein